MAAHNDNIQAEMLADLQKLDLSLNESKVLLHLIMHKNVTATDISKQVGISRTETYSYLSTLISKGVVHATFDRPQKYNALSYREVIDCLVQSKENTLHTVTQNKDKYQGIIDTILSGMVTQQGDDRESYQVIIGEESVHAKVKRMVDDTKEEILMLLSDRNLVNFYHAEILDSVTHLAKKGKRVMLQTSCNTAEQYMKVKKCILQVESENMLVNFILSDSKQLIMLLEDKSQKKPRAYGFYTNNSSLIAVFKFVFNKVQETKGLP